MQAIIFDCFGVLTTDYWRQFVTSLPTDQQLVVGELNKAYDSGHLTSSDFMNEVEIVTSRRPNLSDHYRATATKNYELLSYITDLKPTYKIGLLSNVASDWVTEKFLTAEEASLFDVMIFSHNVGLTKPDERIFKLMANRLGVSEGECVMVDDLDANCTGARSAGMQAITYLDVAQTKAELEALLK